MENSTIKTWVEKPSKKEVENHIKLFFDLHKKVNLMKQKMLLHINLKIGIIKFTVYGKIPI